MFGQHPHVGISNLLIDPKLLSNLATEMDVCHSLGFPDIPLEQVNLVNSLGADDRFKNPLTNMSPDADETMQPEAAETTAPEANETSDGNNLNRKKAP